MKKLVLLFAFVGTIASFQAQSKVAHVNTQKLLDTLPSRKVALGQIGDFEKKGVAELKDMEAELQKIYTKYLQDKDKLGEELNAPILKRVQKAVDLVADRKKINYVIDETATLYFKGGTDLTSEVMMELLKLDAAETAPKK